MRFLVSIVFVGMLALSSQAFAVVVTGDEAEKILVKGEVVAEFWDINTIVHQTRVIYKGRYWGCVSMYTSDTTLRLGCKNHTP